MSLSIDKRFIFCYIVSHFLLFLSYTSTNYFWILFGCTQLVLIILATTFEKIYYYKNGIKDVLFGSFSSILLFSVFVIGNYFIEVLGLAFEEEIYLLYEKFTPIEPWHFLLLFALIIPGEEFFWRGYVQKYLLSKFQPKYAILLSSICYALAQVYCGFYILPLIAILAGCFWGYLYYKYNSLLLVATSHLVFNLFLFILFPFY